jgi:CheY-like chemotaxis protein
LYVNVFHNAAGDALFNYLKSMVFGYWMADCSHFLVVIPSAVEMKTVLVVDHDLGFVFWLGQLLDRMGYEALPAKSVPDAFSLLGTFKPSVDVLVVNPSLVNAADLVAALRYSQEHLNVIGLLEGSETLPDRLWGFASVRPRPTIVDEITQFEWLQLIESISDNKPVTQ